MTMTNKPTLVLLPGMLNDARIWQNQSAALAQRADCHVPDLTTQESIAAMAADVLAQVSAPRFALAALSMGGYVALEIMRRAPERVTGLALFGASARPELPEMAAFREKSIVQAQTDFPAIIDSTANFAVHPERKSDPVFQANVRGMMERVGAPAFVRQCRAVMGRADGRPLLASIQCPTLIVCGKQDAVTPPRLSEELARGIAGAELLLLEQCGHLSPLEVPDEVTAALSAWLDRQN